MIIRVVGEGQFEVPDAHLEELNRLDDDLLKACDSGDEARFASTLEALITSVRAAGKELPADYLGASDLVLPGPDSTIEEVRGLLGDEGLIPG
jgi:hypothetical protein